MENEAACNIADCKDLMAIIPSAPENVGILWDPMNATSTGETPYSDGYNLLDKSRIWHVQLKDTQLDPQTGERKTVAVGDGVMPYAEIFKALVTAGYTCAISMETHFSIDGSRDKASRISIEGVFRALDAQA
jgi:sugar phosphate isomerase/epimerase